MHLPINTPMAQLILRETVSFRDIVIEYWVYEKNSNFFSASRACIRAGGPETTFSTKVLCCHAFLRTYDF